MMLSALQIAGTTSDLWHAMLLENAATRATRGPIFGRLTTAILMEQFRRTLYDSSIAFRFQEASLETVKVRGRVIAPATPCFGAHPSRIRLTGAHMARQSLWLPPASCATQGDAICRVGSRQFFSSR